MSVRSTDSVVGREEGGERWKGALIEKQFIRKGNAYAHSQMVVSLPFKMGIESKECPSGWKPVFAASPKSGIFTL